MEQLGHHQGITFEELACFCTQTEGFWTL